MNVKTTKNFDKKLQRLPARTKESFKKKVLIFLDNPFDVRLNNHRLHGSLNKYRSINITGDYRLIYEDLEENLVLLIDINTHSELYK